MPTFSARLSPKSHFPGPNTGIVFGLFFSVSYISNLQCQPEKFPHFHDRPVFFYITSKLCLTFFLHEKCRSSPTRFAVYPGIFWSYLPAYVRTVVGENLYRTQAFLSSGEGLFVPGMNLTDSATTASVQLLWLLWQGNKSQVTFIINALKVRSSRIRRKCASCLKRKSFFW